MKEKYDLSLDNRQIVSLLISSLVVLGAVFVLGVVVGKKLSASQKAAQAPDLLTALDQKATQMEQVQKEPPLTFQDALTAKSPDAVPTPPPAPTTRPKEPAALIPLPAKPETVVAKAQAPKPPPAARAETLHAAFAKASSKTGAKGQFALQVAASQDRKEAERQVARLKEKGYAPYIVTGEVPGKGTWFRVRVGHFHSRDEATRYRQDFTRETRLDAFVAVD